MKFTQKNIENWWSWKMTFFLGGHFEFFLKNSTIIPAVKGQGSSAQLSLKQGKVSVRFVSGHWTIFQMMSLSCQNDPRQEEELESED